MALVDLHSLIDTQRRIIRWHARVTVATILLGLAVTSSALLLQAQLTPEPLKTLLALGGTFLSLLGTWPYKEILAARNRLSLYDELLRRRASADPPDLKRIDDLIDDVVRKTLVG